MVSFWLWQHHWHYFHWWYHWNQWHPWQHRQNGHHGDIGSWKSKLSHILFKTLISFLVVSLVLYLKVQCSLYDHIVSIACTKYVAAYNISHNLKINFYDSCQMTRNSTEYFLDQLIYILSSKSGKKQSTFSSQFLLCT